MPTRRALLRVAVVASAALFTFTYAAPLDQQQQQQQQPFVATSPTTTSADNCNKLVIPSSVAVQNSLCEYYEDIVDQVMETVTNSIFASASHSFMTVRHYQVTGHDQCKTSLPSFVHALGDHLTLVRSNLLASVRPLVQTDLEVILPLTKITSSELALYTRVNDAVIHLNQRLAEQLGQMINVNEAANIIISQSLVDNRYLAHCTGQNSPQLQFEQLVAVLTSFFQPKEMPQLQGQEEQQKPRHHRSIENNEAMIMTRWLHSWLSEIPGILTVEFDKRMHEAVQSVLEDFLTEDE
ncbi:hypothetical protein BDB00DRAFT_976742 [Zychaea mexicana]|uniref:uncharacterized protein n=1 Tax=Zychaea mexicana TaxID=64656 RepID=UPI0022FE28C9|nr:uncharacterized protein BDB00DRAFT_976742 [Zychaea mexicana]KAI9492641.1 hypothetical protein BDB00DRAFT_976742 [Zychaea mexicana]